jgi:mRNA interferase MazF
VAHPIWLARLDKIRPVLLLTREEVRAVRRLVTVAPITSTVRGLSSEVSVGAANGLEQDSVVNLDLITTVPRERLIRPLGALLDNQEPTLTRAFHAAFDLDD